MLWQITSQLSVFSFTDCWCCCCSTWIGCITCIHLFSCTYMYITIHTYIILYWIDLPLLVFSLFLTGWFFVVIVVAARWMYQLHLLTLATVHFATFSFTGFCRCCCCCSALGVLLACIFTCMVSGSGCSPSLLTRTQHPRIIRQSDTTDNNEEEVEEHIALG